MLSQRTRVLSDCVDQLLSQKRTFCLKLCVMHAKFSFHFEGDLFGRPYLFMVASNSIIEA